MRWVTVFAAALVSLSALPGRAVDDGAESVEIPLKEVWGFRMPGTQPIRAGMVDDPAGGPMRWPSQEARLMEEIRRSLRIRRLNGNIQPSAPGFAVSGKGLGTLHQVHDVLVAGMEPTGSLSLKEEVTVVFFSYDFSKYVQMTHVELSGKQLEINFQYGVHTSKNLSCHLALIPLGKLPPGEYHVAINRARLAEKSKAGRSPEVIRERDAQVICQPFSFVVSDN